MSESLIIYKANDHLEASSCLSNLIISDITSTGATLKANNLRILKDGYILKSTACVLFSKKSNNVLKKNSVMNLF